MRKIFTLLLATTFSVGLIAQSIKITRKSDNGDVTNGSYSVSGPPTATTIDAYLVLKNVGSTTIIIKAIRTELQIVNGMDNSMCFGFTCNSWPSGSNPVATFPGDSVILAPGDSNLTCYLQTYPKNNTGCESYRVKLWDANNTADSSTLVVNACAWATGLDELSANANGIVASPNPAKDVINVAYNVVGMNKSASVKILDMVGKVVKEVPLTNIRGNTAISVADVPAGVHFYSLVVDGETKSTKKFVVTH